MPRGGKRPGAGRPKGSKNKTSLEQPEQREHYKGVQSPLDYMLAVMRDPLARFRRRDAMARAAAPYVHAPGGSRKSAAD
jgi:phage terminase small subunit